MTEVNVHNLTAKQEQAILALLSEASVAKAASACDIAQSTLHRWLQEPAFGAAYRRHRREAFGQAIGLLQRYAAMAVNALAKVTTDPAAPPAAKVSAAATILKFGREGIELDDLCVRVEELERIAFEQRAPSRRR